MGFAARIESGAGGCGIDIFVHFAIKIQVMNDQELLQLLHDIESDRVERKESLSDPDRAREAICAFANDRLSEKRRAGDRPFDLTAVPAATIADLDLDLFRRSYLPSALAPELI